MDINSQSDTNYLRQNSELSFLVMQTAFIGDVILATALIEKLHINYPQAKIDFLVRKGNESLLVGHPYLNEVLIWDKKKGKYKSLWKLLWNIRSKRYTYIINLQRFASTGWLTAFSGAKEKVGFDKNPFSIFFTHRVKHLIDKGQHEIDRNQALVAHLTDQTPIKPKLYPSQTDVDTIKVYQTKPYICVAPTSVWFTKQFPVEQWANLLKAIASQFAVFLLGSPQDREACNQIIKDAELTTNENVKNLAGKLSLLASAALMKGAILNYVNDSAPMHLCSALNAPTCAIYCSTIPAFGFGPLAEFSRVAEIDYLLACRPCGLHGYQACPEGHFKCAKDIRIERLLEILNDRKRVLEITI